MMLPPHEDWQEANRRHLIAEFARLKAVLAHGAAADAEPQAHEAGLHAGPEWPPALELVAERFGLSAFERDVLLLCAGMEIDAGIRDAVSELVGKDRATVPCFGLALQHLPSAHWSALAPSAPLRYWQLISLAQGGSLTGSRLAIDERVLHFLTGVQTLDERLTPFVEQLPDQPLMTPGHAGIADAVLDALERHAGDPRPAVVELIGRDSGGKRAVAWRAARALGVQLHLLTASDIPALGRELHALGVLWSREVALSARALYIDCDTGMVADDPSVSAGSVLARVARLVDNLGGVVFVSLQERARLRFRPVVSFEVPRPRPDEQHMLWGRLFGERTEAFEGDLHRVTTQFRLDLDSLRAAGTEMSGLLAEEHSAEDGTDGIARALWDSCRRQARPRLDDLAERIEPLARWEDLILPAAQLDALRQITAHVRNRHQVLRLWRLDARDTRGLGVSALFSGGSGTGKTMAAEVLAHSLRLDLYRIDVSAVVSKYIGETEKNLRRVFDAAEEGGAILLFDEADALFGKRSEVKDSHDRFANIEVSYLLQRMEAYQGLAILTTNMKSALDQAFLRRLRFVIEFPFPDEGARRRIWQGIFPGATPTDGLDFGRLSHLNLAGGNIRNIALAAAFDAADQGTAITMRHVLDAARCEYRKLDRPLQAREFRSWSECGSK
ncbi:MAG: ATP-binding protein [Rhodobacteraceae bacterium]|nr:ATP-binding protein [Paracoccaceae bacterium]